MSKTLELPDPIYDALQEAAIAGGTTPEGWIAAHLPASRVPSQTGDAKSLADLFRGKIGRIKSSGKEALSENCGERFTDYLEEKRRKGIL
jgi:hypothetical protein